MDTAPTVFHVFVNFWLSLIKLLGRPAVQMQLLAAAGAVLLAWLLARWIVGALRRRQAVHRRRLRTLMVAEEQARLCTEVAADADADDDGAGGAPPLDEDALNKAVDKRLGAGSRFSLLVVQLVFPVLAVLFLYGLYVYFVAQDWYSGLLVNLITLFVIYFVFRLALGLAYAFGSPGRVHYYHQRLFGPLFGVFVLLLIANTITDIDTLAAATVFQVENTWLTLGSIFVATVGFYFWIMGVSLLKDLVAAFFGRQTNVNTGSLDAALTLVQYGLIALGLFGVLQLLEFNTTTIAAITGGLSIGVGFALQDVLKNFLGGIILLFEGSVRPGDMVEVSGAEGVVDKLSIRSTIVRTADNVEYIVPNQNWLNSIVTTYTRNSRRVRARVPVGVSYDADPHFVQKLLIETARAHPDVLHEPSPAAPLVDFGASSVDFVVLAWVDDARIKGKVTAELRMGIWDVLKANGIEIPYPQQDLHIRSGLLPPAGDGAAVAAGQTEAWSHEDDIP
ncbi:MAG: mechanosensitive ion channel domain-containing protein [Tetrasphaera sp.]